MLENAVIVVPRLISIIKEEKEESHLKLYYEGIKDKVARKLTQLEIATYGGPVHYVPHHGIMRESSLSTPLRIVFNSSSTFMGHKLNNYWAKGRLKFISWSSFTIPQGPCCNQWGHFENV